jgi:hypothetical protein
MSNTSNIKPETSNSTASKMATLLRYVVWKKENLVDYKFFTVDIGNKTHLEHIT